MAHNVNAAQLSEELLETILCPSTNIGKKLIGKKLQSSTNLDLNNAKHSQIIQLHFAYLQTSSLIHHLP